MWVWLEMQASERGSEHSSFDHEAGLGDKSSPPNISNFFEWMADAFLDLDTSHEAHIHSVIEVHWQPEPGVRTDWGSHGGLGWGWD
jgi:hypothetical protein